MRRFWIAATLVVAARMGEAQELEIQEVVPTVFVALPTERSHAGANAVFIINETDIVVVDTHMTPAAANALVSEIARRSPLPVRFVIQSHWHPDHTQGTKSYVDAYPGVTVLSHRTARREIRTLGVARLKRDLARLPIEIDALRQRLHDADVDVLALRGTLADRVRFLEELEEVKLVLPDLTFESAMTITRGRRKIQLLYFGRGHTAGDAVVYLPAERVAIVGDLVTGGPPFARDGFPREWVETLRALEALDVDRVVSGHGAIRGPEVFKQRREFLEAALAVIMVARREGVPANVAAERIDIESFRDTFDPEPADKPWRSWMRMIVDRALAEDAAR